MSATGAGYDLSVTTYSPDGRVFQVEYAHKAIEKSGTAIGICCSDGCVLAVEKSIFSKMLAPNSNRRIYTVSEHAGIAVSGLAADARQIVDRAISESEEYMKSYQMSIPGRVLNDRLSGFVHMYTLYWYMRPFGCSALLATYSDRDGPELFQVDPSGVSNKYYGAVAGRHKRAGKSELEKLNLSEMTCRQAVKELARIIYKLHDELKDKPFELEMSWVGKESNGRHVPVPNDLKESAIEMAKEIKRKEEMADSDSDSD